MLFISLEFLIFFTIVFIVFFSVPLKFRLLVLLLASFYFIGVASPVFLFYSGLFVVSNFFVGKLIANKDFKYRKQIYFLGQTINIGGLVFYKYINFLFENINFGLNLFSKVEIPYLTFIIPLGISYYTFQGISYQYLIYKANDKPEPNILNMALYMLFFTKIMAGPIERHRTFLPQLRKNLEFDYNRVIEGSQLVLWGLFKKVVIGDTFAIMVTKMHGNIDVVYGPVVVFAFLLQPIQLYCDFSGYTDMAIGFSRIFGLNLSPNFNQPFLARTVGEFWRRWHISLSSWCNDFIYNRLLLKHRKWGDWAAIYAIFVSFMIIGIWHGAKWTYVMVGVLQVLALSYEFLTRRWRGLLVKKYPEQIVIWGSRILLYLFVCLFLTFFFSDTIGEAFTFLKNMVVFDYKAVSFGGFFDVREELIVAGIAALFVLINDYYKERGKGVAILFANCPTFIRWSTYLLALILIAYFSNNESVFVYKAF